MRRITVVLLAIACSLAVSGVATSATILRLSADPTGALKFNKKILRAKAGRITISMHNPSPLPHNIAVKGLGRNVKGKIVPKNGTSRVIVTLKKGRYTFYCSVPGHEAAGMKGTLIVT